ncbi:uncharacterized protein LOC133532231 isoform X1 [Cydia pomonella]|uniref:uncharacterized protein LOC133532231 isoform X1 n=1 Tax=Cydia pomonella TaxID=82600 RepID=UPI002ADDEA75|nr:uncharacterized protein LOC133532231 isoform X1 [Cydia pomonella]
MMQRRGSFFVLICILRQTITQQLSQDAYQKGAVPSRRPTEDPKLDTERQTEMLMMSAADIIHGTNPMVWRTADIRMRSDQCASFEVGFVFKTLEDTFRKMLDIYNMTTEIRKNRTAVGHGHHGDHMVYLQKIEKLHWRVYHLHNMLHEVERKYKMDATINACKQSSYNSDRTFSVCLGGMLPGDWLMMISSHHARNWSQLIALDCTLGSHCWHHSWCPQGPSLRSNWYLSQ